jgi:hypothetical protein
MADLITPRELALWTGNTEADVVADEFAAEVMEKVSDLVRFLGGHPEWTLDVGVDQVPYDVRLLVLVVAKRCYENPAQVVQEGSVGPIGGDRVLDVAALLFELSETERTTLTKYNPDGDPDAAAAGLWVLTTTVRPETQIEAVLYVGDDQQVNLGDEREWMIPMFNPGDPGDPNLYQEG